MTADNLAQAPLKPLAGIRVAEIGHSAAAATVGITLAELGADVSVMPHHQLKCGGCLLPAEARAVYAHGVPLDRSGSDDSDGAYVDDYDILIDDSPLCLENPGQPPAGVSGRIIVRITPFCTPQDGSPARRGTPYTAECASGISIALGDQGAAPLRLPAGVTESIAGLNAVGAVLALLLGDDGQVGRHSVEVSLASSLEYLAGMNNKMFEGYPREWQREGRRSAGSSGPYPLAIFEASDGLLGLVARSKGDWESILAAMGDPEWAQAEEFRDPYVVALKHADQVDEHVAAWAAQLTIAEVIAKSREFGFVAAPVLSLTDAMASPQLAHRGFWKAIPGATAPQMNLPMRRLVTAEAAAQTTGDLTNPARRRMVAANPRQLLAGVRVLDFTWVWSGPMATGILASLGAEVIKVEHETRPDGARMRGRPNRPDGLPREGPPLEVTPYFHQNGAGKLSLRANLGDAYDRALLARIAREADVIVENMRPGTLARKGLGFTDLTSGNPSLVMLSMSVAGSDGPLAMTRGYATVMSGLAGYESLIGYGPDRVTGGYTLAIADPVAGLFGAIGVMAALLARERDGGSLLDMSQLEAMMHMLRICVGYAENGDAVAEGVSDRRVAHQRAFRVRGDDNWVGASFGTHEAVEEFHDRLRTLLGQHPQDEAEFWSLADDWAAGLDGEVLVAELERCGAMAVPVVTWRDDATRRAYLGDEASVSLFHPFGRRERIFVPPWLIDGARPGFDRRAPLLGEHTDYVLDAFNSHPDPQE